MNCDHVAITQASAGTTELVAAPGIGYKIEAWGFTIVQASGGTATLKSGTTALTGAMPGGSPITPSGLYPILVCAENQALNLVTTTNAAYGELRYRKRLV